MSLNLKEKLKTINLYDLNTLNYVFNTEIEKLLHLTPKLVKKLKNELPKGKNKIWLTHDITKISKKSNLLSSGSLNLNSILNGGFFSSKVYFIFGEFKTGKTQLCLQLATNIISKFKNQSVKKDQYTTLIFDTENTFKPERIKQLASGLNLEPEVALKSINIVKVIGSTALYVAFEKIEKLLNKNDYKLLIIDSLTNHFRADQNDENINQISLKKNFLKILKIINEITEKYNLITILTGHVSPNFSENSFFRVKPFALNLLNHYFSEFIYLNYVDENKRLAHIINSDFLPERKTIFLITEDGIRDYQLLPKK